MQELVTYLARRLVDEPDEVRVDAETDGDTLHLSLSVAARATLGKVIGKQGRIIRAMRTVVRSGSARRDQRVTLEIVE